MIANNKAECGIAWQEGLGRTSQGNVHDITDCLVHLFGVEGSRGISWRRARRCLEGGATAGTSKDEGNAVLRGKRGRWRNLDTTSVAPAAGFYLRHKAAHSGIYIGGDAEALDAMRPWAER